MNEEYEMLPLVKNEKLRHFELSLDGLLAYIKYEQEANVIKLIHTKVDPKLEGKGMATAIIEKTLDYIEKNNFKLIPICPFVVAYIKRHPEWKRIIEEKMFNVRKA